MQDVKQRAGRLGLILYDILSYYIRPNFDLDRMLPSLEFGAELGFPYALAICRRSGLEPPASTISRACASRRRP